MLSKESMNKGVSDQVWANHNLIRPDLIRGSLAKNAHVS